MSDWFALFSEDDDYQGAVCSLNGYDAATRVRAVSIPRRPGDFESWDKGAGEFVIDLEAKACHAKGPDMDVRVIRAIEAHLIAAGIVNENMLVAKEAQDKKVDIKTLARDVISGLSGSAVDKNNKDNKR